MLDYDDVDPRQGNKESILIEKADAHSNVLCRAPCHAIHTYIGSSVILVGRPG